MEPTLRTHIARSASMPVASSKARSQPTFRSLQAAKFELVINAANRPHARPHRAAVADRHRRRGDRMRRREFIALIGGAAAALAARGARAAGGTCRWWDSSSTQVARRASRFWPRSARPRRSRLRRGPERRDRISLGGRSAMNGCRRSRPTWCACGRCDRRGGGECRRSPRRPPPRPYRSSSQWRATRSGPASSQASTGRAATSRA